MQDFYPPLSGRHALSTALKKLKVAKYVPRNDE